MHRKLSWLTLAAAVWVLAACSSGNSSPPAATPPPAAPPPPATIAVSGAVVDGPVAGATISAYAVSAAGVPGTTALATATTSATGSYSLNLPAGTTGAILLTSTGGTFVDDVTGQTINAPTLSAIIPDVSGATTVAAQLTPLTSIAAQIALATSSASNSVSSVASAINTALGAALGGQSDIVGTPLVDVSTAGCATAASQASLDASLVLAGIDQLAANNNVSSVDLIAAVVADVLSDNKFDGTANGVALTVPLSGGTVQLCTIEGNCPGGPITGLAQQLGAAVAEFQASPANTCGATESSSQQQALSNAPSSPPPIDLTFKYSYTLTSTISGFSGPNAVMVGMNVLMKCADDTNGAPVQSFDPTILVNANGSFSIVTGANGIFTDGDYAGGFNTPNDCGQNTWTLHFTFPSDLSCSVTGASGPPFTGTFTSSDGGNTNVAASPPTISCSPLYSVGGSVSGLSASGLVLLDNGGDALPVPSGATTFTFATWLAANAAYAVTVQSSPAGESCVVGSGSGTIGNANVGSVAVTCTSTGGTGPGGPAAAINGPGGMVFYKNLLYVTNGGANQVLVFSEQLSGKTVTGLTQVAAISSAHMTNPGRLAMDANGDLYVASLGTGNGTGTVTVFDTTNNNTEVTTTGGGAILSDLDRPLGIAVDTSLDIYVADNAGNSISVYAPTTKGSPAAGYAAPIVYSQDADQHSFLAPGVIFEEDFSSVVGSGNDYVLTGLGPGGGAADSVLLYKAPFTSPLAPLFDLTSATCSSMPSGPTGIAVYPNQSSLSAPALLSSVIYVASFYNNNVNEYPSNEFFPGLGGSTTNTCPTPITNGNGVNKPEGIAVDSLGNVFVSNAGSSGANANTITVYTGGSSFANGTPIYTYPAP